VSTHPVHNQRRLRPAAGRACILLAALLWSTGGLFAKMPLFEVWPSHQRGLLLAFWRALFAGVLLLPLARRVRLRRAQWPMALCFAAMNGAYLTALSYTSAGNAIWLQSTAPVWVFLLGAIVLRNPIDRRDLVTVVFAAAGLGIILVGEWVHAAGPELPGGTAGAATRAGSSLWGVCLALAAGLLYACVVLLLRTMPGENAVWLVAFNLLFTAAALLPLVVAIGRWPQGWQWPVLAAFGLLQLGVPYLLFLHGLRATSSQEASLLALIEPLLVPVWVHVVLQNAETQWWTYSGGSLILGGLVLRYAVLHRMAASTTARW
jgi:DME family drug/metabolite transporter